MDEIVVGNGWRERLEAFAGRRREVRLVAAVVGIAVLVAVGLWMRASPARVAPPAVSSPQSSVSPTSMVLVHVAGAVRRPGVYELEDGARVADALKAARGPRHNAELDALNLAESLRDGMRVLVPRRGETIAQSPGVPSADPAVAVVNVNVADQAALETIPGIGPAKAAAILMHRAEIGRFETVEQLLDVRGIGPATLESMRPFVTV